MKIYIFCRMRTTHRRRIQGMGGSLLALPLLEANSKLQPQPRPSGSLPRESSIFVPENFHPKETGKLCFPLSTPRSIPQGLHGFRLDHTPAADNNARSFCPVFPRTNPRVCRGQRVDRSESRPIRRRADTLRLLDSREEHTVMDPQRERHSSDTQPGEALSNALPQGRWPLARPSRTRSCGQTFHFGFDPRTSHRISERTWQARQGKARSILHLGARTGEPDRTIQARARP